MAILGLLNTESDPNWRFQNIRRQVFYFYPNGAAPLTGLLSLLQEEDTDDPQFSWYEKRLAEQRSTMVVATTTLVFTATPSSGVNDSLTADGAATLTMAGFNAAGTAGANQMIRFRVADSSQFRAGHIVRIPAITWTTTGAGTFDLIAQITFVSTANAGLINARILAKPYLQQASTTLLSNLAAYVGKEVLVIGSSFQKGQDLGAQGTIMAATSEIYTIPVNPTNNAQIFRTPFSMTGTALKTGLKYDETGPYKDKAKESSVQHMIEMEKGFLFGYKSKTNVAGLLQFQTGGILGFLIDWEAGTIYGNAAATLDTDDNKRIISNVAGSINEKTYEKYLERVFRVTNNTANEKLVLCGSGFLSVINQMYKSKTTLTADLPLTDTYGMSVVRHQTPYGTIYYKSHPLFSQNAAMRYNALFLDIQNLRYRYVQGRDTELLKNRQPNDADYRKDEWLTEAGLECRFPESHMYLQNVTDYTP